MKLTIEEAIEHVLPVAAVIYGVKLPVKLVTAVHAAVQSVETLNGLSGDMKRAKARELIQAEAKELLGEFLPSPLVNLLIEVAVVVLRQKG